ncbi:MAG: glycosyltransferase family 39 protein [Candidatus Roizmanbacteria bacterium]|nr:MAG: glycosyltransferase family 39 protein [Candidatus Roizmanbacteria bacterium]
MTKSKLDRICILFIVIISVLVVFDLFFNKGHSAWMDGRVHITTITQFFLAIKDGDFKVTWLDGIANYGMPFGFVGHQLISYLGAFVTFLTNDVLTSWKIIALIGALLSNLFFYFFLRIYFSPVSSLLAVFLYNVAPYRILNLYVREALPEFFASLFFPLIPLCLYYLIKKRKFWAIPALTIATALFTLNHPMLLVVSAFFFISYLIFLLKDEKSRLKLLILSGTLMAWGILIAAYYIIPLQVEIKYFYYGIGNHLTPGQYLSLKNFIDPNWYYFLLSQGDIINRGHFVKVGEIELIGVVIGLLLVIWRLRNRKKWQFTILELTLFLSLLVLFLTTKYSLFLYQKINLLSNIQFPWRMLSLFIFLPPIIFAYIFEKFNWKVLMIIFVLVVALMRFPQLYSKNNTDHPMSRYLFTTINIHSTNMNTVWTGETDDYPIKKNKGEIIRGKGKITSYAKKNSSRKYKVEAESDIRMADYTFYFPGWTVYVDGVKTNIEFQDPDYRGVITYNVPAGKHDILVKFEDTKVRTLGNIISVVSLDGFLIAVYLQKRFRYLQRIFKYPNFS